MSKRNYGIDVIRFLSMFGIIGLHFLGQGGILSNLKPFTFNYLFFNIIYIIIMSSVNIFAIITGYMYIDKKKYNSNNLLKLLLTMILFSCVITLIFYIFDFYNIRELGIKKLLIGIFPPIICRYWYITAYSLVFLLIPFINKLLNNLNKKSFKNLIIILSVAYCFFSIFITKDALKIDNGYSPFWLIYCYLLGAYIKLYNIKILNNLFFIINIAIVMITTSLGIKYELFNILSARLMFYNSPLIVINSILLFNIFKKIKFEKFIKVINYLSITSFGVYILHCHPYIYDFVQKNIFPKFFDVNSLAFILIFFVILILVYLFCSIIEYVRLKIFNINFIKNLLDKISTKINEILYDN